jgi:AraC-like DNA-binding protein
MLPTVRAAAIDGLERSCGRRSDSIRFGPSAYGVERAEVFMSARGFDPHRHDVYAIGVTTAGVATFRYRGSQRVCLLGQLQFLHPDETHDGGPGTEDGFGYRILYIPPELVRGALGGRALPFVADPVQEPKPTARRIVALLADIDDPISELSCAEIAVAVADCLLSFSDRPNRRGATVDTKGVEQVREYLAAHAREQTPASTLEKIAGADRFTITRHFRWAFGTSPDRYRTLRRLALAQAAIESGQSLAQVAIEAGFADQSHMTRQFKRTYGLTPTRWRALTAASSTDEAETCRPGTRSPHSNNRQRFHGTIPI